MCQKWEGVNLVTTALRAGGGSSSQQGPPLATLRLFGYVGLVGQPREVGRKIEQGVAII
jgi:hypothetical protein